MNKLSLAVAFATALTLSSPAQAIVTFLGADEASFYSDPRPNAAAAEADFMSAAGATTLIDFENAPAGAVSSLSLLPGVTFSGSNSYVTDTSACSINCGGNSTAGGARFIEVYGGSLTTTFANPIRSFGVYIGGIQPKTLSLTFNNGEQQSILLRALDDDEASGVASLNFVGFTDTTGSIRSVTLDATGDIVSFDDMRFSYAAAAPVPEPATWAMMIVGFGLVGGAMRHRARNGSSAYLQA